MTTKERSALAEIIAGTGDKKSRPYKAAIRQLQRENPGKIARSHGRKPPKVRQRTREIIERGKRRYGYRLRGANVRFCIKWYRDSRRRTEWIPANGWEHLNADEMYGVELDEVDGGNPWPPEETPPPEAWALFAEFLLAYGVGNISDWLEHVEIIKQLVEPA